MAEHPTTQAVRTPAAHFAPFEGGVWPLREGKRLCCLDVSQKDVL